MKYNWQPTPQLPAEVAKNLTGFEPLITTLLWNRGIENAHDAKVFLHPSPEQFHDPLLLNDMEAAVETILASIYAGEQIYVYGDYDADGICATSIVFDFLYRELKAKILPHIPSRFEEGYGLNDNALAELVEKGAKLIITVDCGISNGELIAKYSRVGVKFIVTDHHTVPADRSGLELAKAIIHPQLSPNYPFSDLCGTAVAWKLIVALRRRSQETGLIGSFDADKYLDLVALATNCDIMPLKGENRTIVALGLKRVNSKPNPGLKALLEVAQIYEPIAAYHFGYVLGPRLNASGRVENALSAVKLLTSQDSATQRQLAQKLDDLNKLRQKLTSELLLNAEKQVQENLDNKLYFVHGEEWPEGIVGLVAGKLTEKYSRPVLVASIKNGVVVGSARSIVKFNITEAISTQAHLLSKYGGHAQAAGYTLDHAHLDEFKAGLVEIANTQLSDLDLQADLIIDAKVSLADIDKKSIAEMQKLEPFGFGNRTPTLAVQSLQIISKNTVGKEAKHLKLRLKDKSGKEISCIGFGLGEYLDKLGDNVIIDIAGNPELNEWNGNKSVQFKLRDIRIHEKS